MYLRAVRITDDGAEDDYTGSWLLKLCYQEDHVLVTDFGRAGSMVGGNAQAGPVYSLHEEQNSFNRFKIDKSGTALSDFVTTWQVSLPELPVNLGVSLEKRQVFRFTQDGSIHLEMGEGITLYRHTYHAHEPESLTRSLVAMIKCGWAYSGRDALEDIPGSVLN